MIEKHSSLIVVKCPYNDCKARGREKRRSERKARSPDSRRRVRKPVSVHGRYHRADDDRTLLRFRCGNCRRTFSEATGAPEYRQKKRSLNAEIAFNLCSLYTQRRLALRLNINRKTVIRKFIFLSRMCRRLRLQWLAELAEKGVQFSELQFDEMRSSIWSKCLPVSIPIIVTKGRQILSLRVGEIPANGRLAAISRKKYGPRKDERDEKAAELFQEVQAVIAQDATITTDRDVKYPGWIQAHLPNRRHETVKGRRGCVAGQGEMKKGGFDPLFAFNHTAAMFRANVCRLIRRTWNTSKRKDRLELHLELYAFFHNVFILRNPAR